MRRIPMPNLIVLLPGIAGTVLAKDGQTVWGYSPSSLAGALLTRGRSIREALTLHQDPWDVDDIGDGVVAQRLIPDLHLLPGLWKIDGYTKVVEILSERFDVVEGDNLFAFPYDWRRDNRNAASRLARQSRDWLRNWRLKSGNENARLVLVAHSMGGIVARYFIEALEGWKVTDALLTFGTPYRGSLNALDTLVNGLHKGPFDLIDLSEMARTFNSIYQLLPIYDCYDPGDGQLRRIGETAGIPNVDEVKAGEALKFHRELADRVQENVKNPEYVARRYAIHPVVGIAQNTLQSARARHGGVDLLQSIKGTDWGGDGTVPRVSAVPTESKDAQNAMYAATQHGSLQNADATLVHIEGVLSGAQLNLGDFRQVKAQVSVEVDDLFWLDEPIEVHAHPTSPGVELFAMLYESGVRNPAHIERMRLDDKDWQKATFGPIGPGTYRVVVDGEGAERAEAAFAVAGVKESEV